jgi:hypothetical protein
LYFVVVFKYCNLLEYTRILYRMRLLLKKNPTYYLLTVKNIIRFTANIQFFKDGLRLKHLIAHLFISFYIINTHNTLHFRHCVLFCTYIYLSKIQILYFLNVGFLILLIKFSTLFLCKHYSESSINYRLLHSPGSPDHCDIQWIECRPDTHHNVWLHCTSFVYAVITWLCGDCHFWR